jgi:hypothetical protein
MSPIIDLGDIRFRRDVERLHRLGPRATEELLLELGRELMLRVHIERRVARYAERDPAVLAAIEGW